MGKVEFDKDAVAPKPLRKTLTIEDRLRIEAEVPKKMTRAEAKVIFPKHNSHNGKYTNNYGDIKDCNSHLHSGLEY